jgi:hypothetical protein
MSDEIAKPVIMPRMRSASTAAIAVSEIALVLLSTIDGLDERRGGSATVDVAAILGALGRTRGAGRSMTVCNSSSPTGRVYI